MARKRYSDEDVLKLLREIDVHLHDGFVLAP
jgi:putative transposase